MSGFVLHPDAVADLDEIGEFIAAGSLDAADHLAQEIHQEIQSLVPFSHVGHVRSDLSSRPLRIPSLRDFLIAYAPEEKPLVVSGHAPWTAPSARHRCDLAGKKIIGVRRLSSAGIRMDGTSN